MKSLGILWNTVMPIKEEVLADISQLCKVIEIFELNLAGNYEEFVRNLYLHMDIEKWKIDKKIEAMYNCNDKKDVIVLIMDFSDSAAYYHQSKQRQVYQNLETCKLFIRNKYSEKIPEYFYDNVFHMTDDEEELKLNLIVINKFFSKEKGHQLTL